MEGVDMLDRPIWADEACLPLFLRVVGPNSMLQFGGNKKWFAYKTKK